MPGAERPEGNLDARMVFHYSRVADWLGSRSWYRDDAVTEVVKFLISGQPKRVLELCCGTGNLLTDLSNAYPATEFVGTDISPAMIEWARWNLSGKSNVRLYPGDWIDGISLRAQPFDVVIVKNALHLLSDVVARLAELRRVCGEWTSLIVVETVSPSAEANAFVRRLFRVVDEDHVKQNVFTEKSLSSVLSEAGWAMTQTRPWFVRQHVDTEDWLRKRCRDNASASAAMKLIAEEPNIGVRRAMGFYSQPGCLPARMLRLQFIARYVYFPKPRHRAMKREAEPELQFS